MKKEKEEYKKVIQAYHSLGDSTIGVLLAQKNAAIELRDDLKNIHKTLLFVAVCSGVSACIGLSWLLSQIVQLLLV